MHIIKLNATDSTNTYLKELLLHTNTKDFTVVVAKKQTKGRGQMGTNWISEDGKNLTFSVLRKKVGLDVSRQFELNMKVSLAIFESLKWLNIPDLSIKWPNDILSANQKICGILIENILLGSKIQSSVIGIGINVNQLRFGDLPKVTSLKSITGIEYNLDEVLQIILSKLAVNLKHFDVALCKDLSLAYQRQLFRINKPSTFKDMKGNTFMGLIKGVSQEGKLQLLLEDEIMKEFALKEIQLLY